MKINPVLHFPNIPHRILVILTSLPNSRELHCSRTTALILPKTKPKIFSLSFSNSFPLRNGQPCATFPFIKLIQSNPSPESRESRQAKYSEESHEKFSRIYLQTRRNSPKRALNSSQQNPSPRSFGPVCFTVQNP